MYVEMYTDVSNGVPRRDDYLIFIGISVVCTVQ